MRSPTMVRFSRIARATVQSSAFSGMPVSAHHPISDPYS